MEPREIRVTVAEFRAKFRRFIDDVALRRTAVIITKAGKPVAKLAPFGKEPIDPFGRMAGTIKFAATSSARLTMSNGLGMKRTFVVLIQ